MTEAITKKCSQKKSGISRADYSNSTWLIHTKSRRRQVHGLRWQAIVFLRSQPVLGWRASWGDRAWIQLSLLNKLPDSPAWLTDRFASARQQSPHDRHKSLLNLYRLLLKYAQMSKWPMALLQSVGRKILTYVSPRAKEQSAYFKITRDISEAQFYLGNRFQEIYLWQEVADRDMDVSRIENLLYGCSFHDDEVAMTEADESFMSKK